MQTAAFTGVLRLHEPRWVTQELDNDTQRLLYRLLLNRISEDNLYVLTHNDPYNLTDYLGLQGLPVQPARQVRTAL